VLKRGSFRLQGIFTSAGFSSVNLPRGGDANGAGRDLGRGKKLFPDEVAIVFFFFLSFFSFLTPSVQRRDVKLEEALFRRGGSGGGVSS